MKTGKKRANENPGKYIRYKALDPLLQDLHTSLCLLGFHVLDWEEQETESTIQSQNKLHRAFWQLPSKVK